MSVTGITLGSGITLGHGITLGSGSGGGGNNYPPGIFLNAGTFNPGDTMNWLFNKVLANTTYYIWVDNHAYPNSAFTPNIVDGTTSITTDGNGNATFSLVLNNSQTGGTFNMYIAPNLYQGNGAGGVGFMSIVVNASSGGGSGGGGAGAGGGAVALNISGISGTTVPDTSPGHNNGTLVGSYTTGSDSHGSYVYLNGGYIDLSGINLTQPFTVRLITAIDGSQSPWNTLWGNESYDSQQGYFAYLSSDSQINVGPVDYTAGISGLTFTSIAQWDFVITDTSVKIYKNSTQIGSTYTITGYPANGDALNDLYIGSRHQNSGYGSTDACHMKVYAVNIFFSALSSSTIASDFATNQTTFSI